MAESMITFPSTDIHPEDNALLDTIWNDDKSRDWEVYPYRCQIVNGKFVVVRDSSNSERGSVIGYVGTYSDRGESILGMMAVQSLVYNPDVEARLKRLHELEG